MTLDSENDIIFHGDGNISITFRPYPVIRKVIFHFPATIVLWEDGSKTVVKVHGDEPFDPEKGLAMAISKKYCQKTGMSYRSCFKKPISAYRKQREAQSKTT